MLRLVYLDASILTGLALRDSGFDRAGRLISEVVDPPIISDFGWGEFTAAVGSRVRRRDIREPVGHRIISDARTGLIVSAPTTTTSADIAEATKFVADFQLALKLPDAIHIAIARRLGATLVSTDQQQVAAAEALGIDCVNPLTETS